MPLATTATGTSSRYAWRLTFEGGWTPETCLHTVTLGCLRCSPYTQRCARARAEAEPGGRRRS
eukprot:7206557-Lingulodinium_polyedra.AAC.1